MSKLITDEKIRLSIEINGNNAQKDLLELEKSTRKLNEANKQLLIEKKRLEAQGKKDTAEYKQLTATIKANNAVIDANKVKMQALQSQIGITGLTLTQLRQKATVLRATLSNMIPGTADFQRYQAELSQVNARIGELTGRATQARFSLGSMADGFNRYQALALSFVAALTGVVLSIQKIIDINGKLSEAQSDVMKTTGMTREEVDELTKSFGALKTRTARIELLALATEAGRLGIEGVANVQAFVEQANKMKVALGDDLSDEAIREVGKMVNVYKVGDQTGRDFAGSMDALGSSINEVSASGANQAGFLVDYLKRQAGIAAQAKLSAADNIGYAATFDEIGQSVEVSATAMNKVWMDMF
ncbi:phage tail tape measure protein, partial [Flavobacterium sp.]|uniref:phage tail tape measure protein n=1 Tax=Flavobacterium sp. TaxID=239 RepID=UPI0037C18F69